MKNEAKRRDESDFMQLLDAVHCMDNCQGMMLLPDESIDLVVTSPPYDDLRTYGGHSWDFYGVAWNLARVLKPGGVIVWNVADQTKDGSETGTSLRQALHFQSIGLSLHDTMIYEKDALQFPDKDRYGQISEYMFVLSKGRPKSIHLLTDRKNKSFGRTVTGTNRRKDGKTVTMSCYGKDIKEFGTRFNVWRLSSAKGAKDGNHPAQMPFRMATDHIQSWSNKGDIVLDPFMGSGTTAKAAQELGRHYIGFEINEEYIEICRRRTAQATLGI